MYPVHIFLLFWDPSYLPLVFPSCPFPSHFFTSVWSWRQYGVGQKKNRLTRFNDNCVIKSCVKLELVFTESSWIKMMFLLRGVMRAAFHRERGARGEGEECEPAIDPGLVTSHSVNARSCECVETGRFHRSCSSPVTSSAPFPDARFRE
jgi:hypothetical protein